MKRIELTMQEIWQACKSSIKKSKKLYSRKIKHKDKNYGGEKV